MTESGQSTKQEEKRPLERAFGLGSVPDLLLLKSYPCQISDRPAAKSSRFPIVYRRSGSGVLATLQATTATIITATSSYACRFGSFPLYSSTACGVWRHRVVHRRPC